MPNVNLSSSEKEMKGDLYIFITLKSNYQEIFKSLVNSQDPKKSCFLIPGDEKFNDYPYPPTGN